MWKIKKYNVNRKLEKNLDFLQRVIFSLKRSYLRLLTYESQSAWGGRVRAEKI